MKLSDNLENYYNWGRGESFHAHEFLGAHPVSDDKDTGYIFRVYAPNAQAVEIIGDFTDWRNAPLPMVKHESGIWEGQAKTAKTGQLYKYLVTRSTGQVVEKLDPFAYALEERPSTAAYLRPFAQHSWKDGLWLARRKKYGFKERPVSIYEVHVSSWKDGLTFKRLKDELIPYLVKMHYTHVEFMPVMAHPLGMSWGYQLMGYFALESSYGTPEDFQAFVDACHQNNIGVIVDWVPGHFTRNDDALAYFDGTPTFEFQDPDRANNIRWGALNFDLGKKQVQSFLISSALFWIEHYHIDGIRVDAVSNMLYRDYDDGPWTPNQFGGNRNIEGYDFLRRLNGIVKDRHPDVMMIAEESTADTPITSSIESGGLGFDYKWNLGWMNDTLKFFEMDPIYRKYDFNLLTFSFMYCFSEQYILPFSHDEVVHGKKSLMHKMWGDRYNQFAGLRLLYTYQYCHPGKKLLFMGSEFGQFLEWKYDQGLEWSNLSEQDQLNLKMQKFTSHLNKFYKDHRPLWENDTSYDGLEIIDADNRDQSVLSFIRKDNKGDFLVCVFNTTPVERQNFTIGVPVGGTYEEILNTELEKFGGVWKQPNAIVPTKHQLWKGYQETMSFTLPAMGASIWRLKRRQKNSKKKSVKK